MWSVRRNAGGKPSGEGAVRPGRILPLSISPTTRTVRETLTSAALTSYCELPGDRAAFLRSSRRQDAYRDFDKRHAVIGYVIIVLSDTFFDLLFKCLRSTPWPLASSKQSAIADTVPPPTF